MFYNFKKNKKAFTLVELIVVIAIIAILGTVVGVSVSGFVTSAKKRAVETAAGSVVTTWNLFVAESDSSLKLGEYLASNLDNFNDLTVTYKTISATTTSTQAASATGEITVAKDGYKMTVSITSGSAKLAAKNASKA